MKRLIEIIKIIYQEVTRKLDWFDVYEDEMINHDDDDNEKKS